MAIEILRGLKTNLDDYVARWSSIHKWNRSACVPVAAGAAGDCSPVHAELPQAAAQRDSRRYYRNRPGLRSQGPACVERWSTRRPRRRTRLSSSRARCRSSGRRPATHSARRGAAQFGTCATGSSRATRAGPGARSFSAVPFSTGPTVAVPRLGGTRCHRSFDYSLYWSPPWIAHDVATPRFGADASALIRGAIRGAN